MVQADELHSIIYQRRNSEHSSSTTANNPLPIQAQANLHATLPSLATAIHNALIRRQSSTESRSQAHILTGVHVDAVIPSLDLNTEISPAGSHGLRPREICPIAASTLVATVVGKHNNELAGRCGP